MIVRHIRGDQWSYLFQNLKEDEDFVSLKRHQGNQAPINQGLNPKFSNLP